jgi:hypothetical protein
MEGRATSKLPEGNPARQAVFEVMAKLLPPSEA